jgi:RHS repeat-associated protein
MTYDDNGNLTQDQRFKYAYDAWNRLVGVTTTDDLAIGVYTYDGRNHRIKKVVTNSGELDGSTYFYHNKNWQLLETRDGSENLDEHSIWGTQYIDVLVRFEKQDYGTMIAYHDHNYNITSITNFAGAVLERITYTPYGQPSYNVATINGDYDADGDIDSSDNTNFESCDDGGSGVAVTGQCRVFDFDNDGDVDLTDFAQFQLKYTGSTEIYRKSNVAQSANSLSFTHQGLILDTESSTYQNRQRNYDQWIMRFAQRDPFEYVSGPMLYSYVSNSPLVRRDPSGEISIPCAIGQVTTTCAYVSHTTTGLGLFGSGCQGITAAAVTTELTAGCNNCAGPYTSPCPTGQTCSATLGAPVCTPALPMSMVVTVNKFWLGINCRVTISFTLTICASGGLGWCQ